MTRYGSSLWVLLIVICQTSIARLKTDSRSGAIQIQMTESAPSETEYDQNNLLYVDIKGNSKTEAELWNKVLLQLSSPTQNPPGTENVRRKRQVFGTDDRVPVPVGPKAQSYPFSTVVLLSGICTGTLVGERHVLTSAHCIHNGSQYFKDPRQLKIGTLNGSKTFQWMRVERAFLPKKWKNIKQSPEQRLKYDYAILRLKQKHNWPTMALKPCDLKAGSKMQFAGFHVDKQLNSLWYSQCTVYTKHRGMIFNFCDGSKGVSGSGVYVKTHSGLKNAVVGIVTAIGRAKRGGKKFKFNIVNSLTRSKISKISKWISKG